MRTVASEGSNSPVVREQGRPGSRQAKVRNRKARRQAAALEVLESRLLLSTIPAPIVGATTSISGALALATQMNVSSPQIIIDPSNSNKMIAVFQIDNAPANTIYDFTDITTHVLTYVGGAYSVDAGKTWNSLGLNTSGYMERVDFTVPPPSGSPPVLFTMATDPSAAFDGNDNVYATWSIHSDNYNGGYIQLQKWNFSGTSPVAQFTGSGGGGGGGGGFGGQQGQAVYTWGFADEAFTPTIAVDSNKPLPTTQFLSGPVGISTGPNGSIVVSASTAGALLQYDQAAGTFISNYAAGLFQQPQYQGALSGNTYTPSPGNDSVIYSTPAAGTPPTTSSVFIQGVRLNQPKGVVYGPDGNLYVADNSTTDPTGNSVLEYDGQTGAFIQQFIKTNQGGLTAPDGLVFDTNPASPTYQDLYVSSSGSNSVLVFQGPRTKTGAANPNAGVAVTSFNGVQTGGGPTTFVGAVDAPSGLSFDNQGNLFVANPGTFASPATLPLPQPTAPFTALNPPTQDTVSTYNPTTQATSTLIQGYRQSVSQAIVVDQARNVMYVVSQGNNTILEYDATSGAYIGPLVLNGGQYNEMVNPTGIALDPAGNVYVAANNEILRYSPSNVLTAFGYGVDDPPPGATIPAGQTTTAVYSNSPNLLGVSNLTFDPVNGDLFATAYNNANNLNRSQIVRVQGPAGLVAPPTANVYGLPDVTNSGLNVPVGLTFGPDNNLYVVSSGNNSIRSYQGTGSASPGTFIRTFAVGGGLQNPTGLAFSPNDGNLYVASRNTVLEYQGSGTATKPNPVGGQFIQVYDTVPFAGGGGGGGNPRASLYGLIFNPIDNNLYVSSSSTAQVLQFDGKAANTFYSNFAQVFNATDTAFDSSGNLYVAVGSAGGTQFGLVAEYALTYASGVPVSASYLGTFVQQGSALHAQGVVSPTNLIFDASGNLYVTSGTVGTVGSAGNEVLRFSPPSPTSTGGMLNLGVPDPSAGNLGAVYVAAGATSPSGAYGLAFDATQNNLFVSGLTGKQNGVLLTQGAVFEYGGPNAGVPGAATALNNFAQIFNPQSVVFDTTAAHNMYVANAIGNMIEEFNSTTGAYIKTFVRPGAGGLAAPSDIAFDSTGDLFVSSDGVKNAVLEFSPAGVFLKTIASGLNNPQGLAFDAAGDLFISDAGNNTVREVTKAQLARPVPTSTIFVTAGEGNLSSPRGLFFDSSGNLLVASFGTNQVMRYFGPTSGTPGAVDPSAGQAGAVFVVAGDAVFTDPTTGAQQIDHTGGDVYIAWATQDFHSNNFSNSIEMIASSDIGSTPAGGTFSFTPPTQVNVGTGEGHFQGSHNAVPKIVISQGRLPNTAVYGPSDPGVPGGQVNVVWDNYNNGNPYDILKENRSLGVSSYTTLPGVVGFINTASAGLNGAPDNQKISPFTTTVNITDQGFTTLSNLTVRVGIDGRNPGGTPGNVGALSLQLVPPVGSGLQPVALVPNSTDTANNTGSPPTYFSGPTLGLEVGGADNGVIFDDAAVRTIRAFSGTWTAAADVNPVGYYVPTSSLLAAYGPASNAGGAGLGATPKQLNGVWTLAITNFRHDNFVTLDDWSITLQSGLQFGSEHQVTTTLLHGAQATSGSLAGAFGVPGAYPLTLPASPDLGVGPAPQIAADKTLGSFSPYEGRLYITYTDLPSKDLRTLLDGTVATNTDIFLTYSDDGGLTWSVPTQVNDDSARLDGSSEGGTATGRKQFTIGGSGSGRPQFDPQVAVDQTTGTVVVSYLDTRNDASIARTATYIATSIDGGRSFGAQTFANPSRTALEPISGQILNLGPLPDNQSTGNGHRDTATTGGVTFDAGTQQGLAVADGHVYPAWTSNLNGGADGAKQSFAVLGSLQIANGPRVISSTQGPVGILGDPINNQLDPIFFGPEASGFAVIFDRPIDPASFTAANIKLFFTDVNGNQTNLTAPANLASLNLTVTALPSLLSDPYFNGNSDPDYYNNAVYKTTTNPFGNTRFLVTFKPQAAVGTYSYVILPSVGGTSNQITDRVRSIQSGPGAPFSEGTFNATTWTDPPTFTTPQTFPVAVPPIGTGGSGSSDDTVTSTITIAAGSHPNDFIAGGTLSLTLTHQRPADLTITLTAPNGKVLTVLGSSLTFPNPVIPFGAALSGGPVDGTYTLTITDNAAGATGTLSGWSITPTATSPALHPQNGNFMDQNANGTTDETPVSGNPGDAYAAPATLSGGTGFVLTATAFSPGSYDPNTLPLIVPGPHVIGTSVPGNPITRDNEALNNTVGSIDVTFDRAISTASFTPAQILRMDTPTGSIVTTPTFNPFTVLPAPVYNSVTTPLAIPANSVPLNATINIGSSFNISDLSVALSLTSANLGNLSLTLISPNNVAVALVQAGTLSGAAGGLAGFSDLAVQQATQATAPYTGIFKPVTPLDTAYAGMQIQGLWTLRIVNTSAVATYTLNAWSIEATPTAATAAGLNTSNFRVSFPTEILSGTYSITLGSGIKDLNGEALDTNLNAGLYALEPARNPSGAKVPITYNAVVPPPQSGATGNIGVVSAALGFNDPNALRVPINITDNYQIAGIILKLDITSAHDPSIAAELIGPDGLTTVVLFQNVGATGNQSNFTQTTFDDNAISPINLAGPPFFGSFQPEFGSLDQKFVTNYGGSPGAAPANGTWTLVVIDTNPNNSSGVGDSNLNSWSLTLQKPVLATGLGETVSDQAQVGFRIFTTAPTNQLASSQWTAVGPASISGNAAGRVTGLAVDPSDPSGNTVYVGGASGGIWKTTDFLTTSGNGPTWVPLTDFGPTAGINIGAIAIFAVNHDPNQSIVFAATGEGDTGNRGQGFLRSMDGGKTWQLLDSTDNTLPYAGAVGSPQRDHLFAQNPSFSFKLAVDPTLTPNNQVIVYAALSGSGATGGIWRSLDTGMTWTRVLVGAATDVTLDPNSGTGGSGTNGNLQIVYAALAGNGVYASTNRGQNWTLILGNIGDPLIQDINGNKINVGNQTSPNGALGRVVLGKPALLDPSTHALQNALYQGWLYALVVNPDQSYSGLYLTKDFGQNWTKVRIPNSGGATPSNNETKPDYNPLSGQGNYDVSMALDPTNPNIVYIGGSSNGPPLGTPGFIRVDTTQIYDAHAFVGLDPNRPDGGTLENNSTGGVAVAAPATNQSPQLVEPPDPQFGVATNIPGTTSGTFNLIRDPFKPFSVNSTIIVANVNIGAGFTNSGANVKWVPFSGALSGSTDQHRLLTIVDPLTGLSRLIFGDDQGVFTGVDRNGVFDTGIGTANAPLGSRNGNLQITQFYYGAIQPSLAAAAIAGGLFYGGAQDTGGPISNPDAIDNGIIGTWAGAGGDMVGQATDQTGSGSAYRFYVPADTGTNFFQVSVNGGPFIGRTSGLVQTPNGINDPQWGNAPVPYVNPGTGDIAGSLGNFAVNPINGNQILISSLPGRIFRTEDQGKNWFVVGEPGVAGFDGTYAPALAYGAPDPNGPGGIGNQDNLLYVGTTGGHLYFTQTGGGGNAGNGSQWTPLSNGLDGSGVQQIIASPVQGNHSAFAVTQGGQWNQTYATTGATAIAANATTNATITVPAPTDVSLQGLTVSLNLSFNNPGSLQVGADSDLKLTLVAPDGTRVPLVMNQGGNGQNFTGTVFSDAFGTPSINTGAAPFSGTFAPTSGVMVQQRLPNGQVATGPLYHKNIQGAWKLEVVNGGAGTATLNSWSFNASAQGGVYYMPDSTAANATWQNITGDLFQNQAAAFGNSAQLSQQLLFLNSIQVDWRYVIPADPTQAINPITNPAMPVLYTSGFGGVFRSLNAGLNWMTFPSNPVPNNQTPTDATPALTLTTNGGLPDANFTELSISDGNIDPSTGRAIIAKGDPNVLLATSFGRGSFAIRLAPIIFPNTATSPNNIALDASTPEFTTQTIGGVVYPVVTDTNQPAFDGLSEQSAFGNTVTINIYDYTKSLTQPIGTASTDPSGHFVIKVNAGVYDPHGADDGLHTIQFQATDQSGTKGNIASFSFVLDSFPPPPTAISLDPVTDTGTFNNDAVTMDNNSVAATQAAPTGNAPLFDVSGIYPGSTVELFRNGVLVNSVLTTVTTPSGGTQQIADINLPGGVGSKIADGTFTYTAEQVNTLGNTDKGPDPSTSVMIDSDSPPQLTGIAFVQTNPNLPATITGKNNNPTPGNAPNFTVSGVEAGATVILYRNGVQENQIVNTAGGTVQIADLNAANGFGTIPDGTYTYSASAIDLAGNPDTFANPTTTLKIDTHTPLPPSKIQLDSSTDSGFSNSDGVTNFNNSLPVSAQKPAGNAPLFDVFGVEPGATVVLYRDGSIVSSYPNAPAGGEVQVFDTNNSATFGQNPIADGTHIYRALQIDTAGVTSSLGSAISVTINAVPPPPPSGVTLDPSSDTGRLNNDNVTTKNDNPSPGNAPLFDVTNVPVGATVILLRAGVEVNRTTNTSGGTVQILDLNTGYGGGTIPNGTYLYSAEIIDLAGVQSAPSPNSPPITIDASTPAVPSPFRLDPRSDTVNRDTQASTADGITQVTLFAVPIFDISGVLPNATVNLYRIAPGGNTPVLVNSTVAGSSGGTVTLSDPGPSPDGTYTYKVQQIDVAGTAGGIGDSGIGDPIKIIYVTAAPPTLPAPTLASPSFNGPNGLTTTVLNPTFNVTGVLATQEPTPAQSNVTVDLVRDGVGVAHVVYTGTNGMVQITDPGPVPYGQHTYRVYQIDDAGNISALSGNLVVNFAIATPAAPVLVASSDSGTKGDNITNVTNPYFDVENVAAGNTVQLLRNGQVVGTRTGPGLVQDPGLLADGTYTYTDDQIDASSGLTSPVSPATSVKIVTKVSAPTSVTLDPASDSGTKGDGITNVTQPTFDIKGVPSGNTVTLYRLNPADGKFDLVVGQPVVSSGGTTFVTEASPLASGSYQYAAIQTDVAANVSGPSPVLGITIQANAVQPVVTLDKGSQSVAGSNVTNHTSLTFDISGITPGATVKLYRNGGTTPIATLVNAPNSQVMLSDAGPLAPGNYGYTATQTDNAGNVSPLSAVLTVKVKTSALAPTIGLDPATDSGIQGDNTTVVRRPNIVGNADTGATVSLINVGSNAVIGTATADATTGAYKIAFPSNLPNGPYLVQTNSVDPAGNSASSPQFVLSITTVQGDYLDTGAAQLAVFRRVSAGLADFFVQGANPPGGPAFGSGTLDVPFQGDLDGDGKTDLVLYRPSSATWYVQQSSAGFTSFTFGAANTDIPVLANFDGTNRSEVAVYRPSTGQWFIAGHAQPTAFGGDPSDIPIPGNYDNTGRDQLAVYRRSTGQWFIAGHAQPTAFGGDPSDIPIPGNYDGTGTELAIFRASTDQWFIGGHAQPIQFGTSGDIPAPADYDGTGKTEIAVYRPSTGQWFIGGHAQPIAFGGPSDIPLTAPYQYRRLGGISAQSVHGLSYDFGGTALSLSVGSSSAGLAVAPAVTAPVAPVGGTAATGAATGTVIPRARPNQAASKHAHAVPPSHVKATAKAHLHDSALSTIGRVGRRKPLA